MTIHYRTAWLALPSSQASKRYFEGNCRALSSSVARSVCYPEQAKHISGFLLAALMRGEARIYGSQFEQAGQEMRALRRLARTIPFPFVAAGALQVQAECALRNGDPQLAVKLFRRAEQEFIAIDAAHRVSQVRVAAERAAFAR